MGQNSNFTEAIGASYLDWVMRPVQTSLKAVTLYWDGLFI